MTLHQSSHPYHLTGHIGSLYSIFEHFSIKAKKELAQATNPMRPSIPPPLLLLLLISVAADASSVEEACRSIATTRPNIGYDFCVASLSSDPSSSTADPAGLAIIAAKLSIANATRIVSKIGSLMEAETDPSLKDCLSACSEEYSDAIDHLNDAISRLSSGGFRDAMIFLSAALDASDNCEEGFDDEGDASLMADDDRDYGRLADIALTVAASLG